MRSVLGAVLAGAFLCSCASKDAEPKVGAHVVKLEPYRWPPDIADQINEEWFNDSPNRRVFGEWRMGWVVLWSLDDSSLEPELIRMFEARVRELVTR